MEEKESKEEIFERQVKTQATRLKNLTPHWTEEQLLTRARDLSL